MHEEILNFIKSFQNEGTIETFTCGRCYWFAKILQERFIDLKGCFDDIDIVYLPVENHFILEILYDTWNTEENHGVWITKRYDITGDVTDKYKESVRYYWEYFKEEEPLESERIIRDCIL